LREKDEEKPTTSEHSTTTTTNRVRGVMALPLDVEIDYEMLPTLGRAWITDDTPSSAVSLSFSAGTPNTV